MRDAGFLGKRGAKLVGWLGYKVLGTRSGLAQVRAGTKVPYVTGGAGDWAEPGWHVRTICKKNNVTYLLKTQPRCRLVRSVAIENDEDGEEGPWETMRSWPHKTLSCLTRRRGGCLLLLAGDAHFMRVVPEAQQGSDLSKMDVCTRSAGRPSNGRALREGKADMPKEGSV